ncbi:MAG: CHAT domain-containing protein [Methylococcaceae bacterium]
MNNIKNSNWRVSDNYSPKLFSLSCLLLLGFYFIGGIAASKTDTEEVLRKIENLIVQGNYYQAIKNTKIELSKRSELKEEYAKSIKNQEIHKLYLLLGHAQYLTGSWELAVASYRNISTSSNVPPSFLSRASLGLAQIYFHQERWSKTLKLVYQSLAIAEKEQDLSMIAASKLLLAETIEKQGDFITARQYYTSVLEYAEALDLPGLQVRARLALAKTEPENLKHLVIANSTIEKIDDLNQQVAADLMMAENVLEILNNNKFEAQPNRKSLLPEHINSDKKNELLTLGRKNLERSLLGAKRCNDPQLISHSYGLQAEFYAQKGEHKKAHEFALKAVSSGLQSGVPGLSRWARRLGSERASNGDIEGAIEAYQLAIKNSQSSFLQYELSIRRNLSLDLTDVLLRKFEKTNDPIIQQSLLIEARNTMEEMQRIELEDYLQGHCVSSHTESIDELDQESAILYPIILKDRLELLVSIKGRMERRRISINSGDLQAKMDEVIQAQRSQPDFLDAERMEYPLDASQQLYEWLIQSVEPILEQANIKTLVIIPSGRLRLLSFPALWSGKDFLISRYAIAISPGISLFDPKSFDTDTLPNTLIAGLSIPGDSIAQIPALINQVDDAPPAEVDDLYLTNTPLLASRDLDEVLTSIVQRGVVEDMLKMSLALPGAEEEAKELHQMMGGKLLFNETFSTDSFINAMSEQVFSIIHIASHAFLGENYQDSFILTHDNKLDMTKLEQALGSVDHFNKPIELLTFSACQTAVGDDQSPLGFAGLAIRLRARSVLGTLWPLSDEAAKTMLPSFYHFLLQPDTSRAKALQQAQLALMKEKRFSHPFYWGSMTLIGNWL